MIYARALGTCLRELLLADPRVILLGEDIADPYGGAFKVTRGLSTEFPERVRTTPVSEGAITGMAAGLALHGFRPIVEIMFGDFISLSFDQIVNHAAKYEAMYRGQATCPLILRTPSGGGRGYGPTHSQSLEKHFLGIPHLRTLAGSLYHDPSDLFEFLVAQEKPALHIEHKLLYPMNVYDPNDDPSELVVRAVPASAGFPPTVSISAVEPEECTVTVVAYGYQATQAARLLGELAIESEIFVHLLVPSQIAPLDDAPILASVARTGRLVTFEEGTAGWAWGAQISDLVQRELFGRLLAPVRVLTSASDIVPSGRELESRMLVSSESLAKVVREMVSVP